MVYIQNFPVFFVQGSRKPSKLVIEMGKPFLKIWDPNITIRPGPRNVTMLTFIYSSLL